MTVRELRDFNEVTGRSPSPNQRHLEMKMPGYVHCLRQIEFSIEYGDLNIALNSCADLLYSNEETVARSVKHWLYRKRQQHRSKIET